MSAPKKVKFQFQNKIIMNILIDEKEAIFIKKK